MSRRKVPNDEILKKEYLIELKSSGAIAKEHGCTRASVCKHLRRLKIVRPASGVNSRNRNYRKKQFRNGYPVTFIPNHPRANHLGYVFDHLLVIEKFYGHPPDKGTPVHHIDFDRKNKSLDNLYLCKSNSHHQKIHASLREAAVSLFRKGVIRFKNGKYCLEED